jgi:hypothetical protein
LDFDDGARRRNERLLRRGKRVTKREFTNVCGCAFAHTLLIIFSLKNRIIFCFTLSHSFFSLSHSRMCFLRRGRARASTRVYVSHSHQFSLFSLIHSFYLLNKLPPLDAFSLRRLTRSSIIQKSRVEIFAYSTPSILSSTSMYNCRKRSMFSSLVSQ